MVDCKHILGAVASAFAETVWPTRCVGCDMPGTLLCGECERRLPVIDARLACPRCGAPFGWLACATCTPGGDGPQQRLCADDFSFAAARAAYVYGGVAKNLVKAYKDEDELRLDATIAAALAARIAGANAPAADAAAPEPPAGFGNGGACATDWSAWADALVAVPASPGSLRRRGYDHMERIARLCARECGLPLLHPLASGKTADQRRLSAAERAANRAASFGLAAGAQPLPARVVLVDDVLTTGATANAAGSVLRAGGAEEVRVAVFARVW